MFSQTVEQNRLHNTKIVQTLECHNELLRQLIVVHNQTDQKSDKVVAANFGLDEVSSFINKEDVLADVSNDSLVIDKNQEIVSVNKNNASNLTTKSTDQPALRASLSIPTDDTDQPVYFKKEIFIIYSITIKINF